MIGWLWRMLVGRFVACPHKWEQQGAYENRHEHYPHHKCMVICLKCTQCGDVKKRII